jgi:hypothetical protein
LLIELIHFLEIDPIFSHVSPEESPEISCNVFPRSLLEEPTAEPVSVNLSGDVLDIKSHPPNEGLIIKAVGIVVDDTVSEIDLGFCLEVEWVWQGYEVLGRVDDKYNVRNTTLYEEVNPDVQQNVINLLLTSLDR